MTHGVTFESSVQIADRVSHNRSVSSVHTSKVERVQSAMETTSKRPLNENFYEQNRKHRRSSMTSTNKNNSVRRRALSIKSTSDLRAQTPQLSSDKKMRTCDD